MAYMSQEHKKELQPAIMAICKRYGIKASLAVKHYSTLVLNIASGPIDFLTQYNERTIARLTEQDRMQYYEPSTYADVNEYHYRDTWQGPALDFLSEVIPAMMIGNHNNSDPMTDYFDVGWYIDINIGRYDKPYLLTVPPATPEPSPVFASDTRIEEHTHTMKGFQMFIVVMAERVERDEYLRLLDHAKSLNGWYSRAYGTCPAGFAFKERSQAESFLASSVLVSEPTNEDIPTIEEFEIVFTDDTPPVSSGNTTLATRLTDQADRLQSAIDAKLADRLTNTPKRMAQAAHARLEGFRLQRTQIILRRLAALHTTGTCPADLAHIKSKKEVYDRMRAELTPVSNGYHGYHVETGNMNTALAADPIAVKLWSLLGDDRPAVDPIKMAIEALQFSNIPGYFPTPPTIVERMLEYADIEPGHRILEPSAGSGNIADRLLGCDCIERHHSLAEILRLKGHKVIGDDLLEMEPQPIYDRIIANPPFDRGLDIVHIKRMMEWLAPGGRIVAIAAGGPRRAEQLQPIADHWETLPEGSFKSSGTGVSSVLMVISA